MVKMFVIVLVSVLLFCNCVSLPMESHEVSEDSIDTTETDAEYICSSNYSITELKSLANSNDSCHEKDYDLEFWMAACRCTFEPHLTCPACNEQVEQRSVSQIQTLTSSKTTSTIRPTGPTDTSCSSCSDQPGGSRIAMSTVTSKSTLTTRPTPTDSPSSKTTRSMTEGETHAKLIRTTSNSINFIRFG